MEELERRALAELLAWRATGYRGDQTKLIKAADDLAENRCTETGVGGDPAWPYMFECELSRGHGLRHRDPQLGEWGRGTV